ncbi:MAG: hypothetical protein Q8M34_02930, partial [Thermodesulfovibrionales bacterium]|nr:hypothetical protein [Thermodesulfovibrionales bacterium]
MKENQSRHDSQPRGLSFSDINTDWKLDLDADNVFWGLAPKNDNGDFLLPEDLITLHKNKKAHLDKELHDFRFNTDLNCVYIDPTDRCNANCTYCYIPAKIRKQGTQMTGKELN